MNADKVVQHRQEFPGLANKVYFNFGGQGILPRSALDAIIDAYKYLEDKGPFSLKVNAWVKSRNGLLRKALAEELGVIPETITLTENVTVGCNIALWGINWQEGDRILITDCEHPGVIAIVGEIARRFGVEVSTCPIMATLNEGDSAQVIAQYLHPKTRLVILSHLLWNTGQVLPLAEIVEVCHNYYSSEKGIQVLVDAAQSVGSLPLNLTELKVDFYAFTGHKWLCGPAGVGGLYISPEAGEKLEPTFIGWRGLDWDKKGEIIGWKNDGQRFEVATSAYPQYEGLRAAMTVHQQWGNAQERYARICQLSEYLWQELSRVEGIQCLKKSPPEAGLVSFRVTDILSHKSLVEALEKQGFLLRTLAHPNSVRACVHYFTLPAEIEQLVEAISQLIQ
jgi:L-cysteine/cystine lyase